MKKPSFTLRAVALFVLAAVSCGLLGGCAPLEQAVLPTQADITLAPTLAAGTPAPQGAAAPQSTAVPTLASRATRTPVPLPVATPLPTSASGQTAAAVVHVVDGDTIKVRIAGQEYLLRYIGINAPEVGHGGEDSQWLGDEATEANRSLVEGRTVYLEKDFSEADRYGRLLRYVYLDDGAFVNAELVRLGLAQARAYPPDVRLQSVLEAAQAEASAAGRGIWGPKPASAGPGCDPSYPDVCIPPPPPDLNCRDISYRRFRVLPPDPHHFDMDGNGIGCERD